MTRTRIVAPWSLAAGLWQSHVEPLATEKYRITDAAGNRERPPLPAPRGSKDNGESGNAHRQGHGCERERDGHAHDDIGHGNEDQRQQAGQQFGHVAQDQVRARALQQDVGKADQLDGKAAAEITTGGPWQGTT